MRLCLFASWVSWGSAVSIACCSHRRAQYASNDRWVHALDFVQYYRSVTPWTRLNSCFQIVSSTAYKASRYDELKEWVRLCLPVFLHTIYDRTRSGVMRWNRAAPRFAVARIYISLWYCLKILFVINFWSINSLIAVSHNMRVLDGVF